MDLINMQNDLLPFARTASLRLAGSLFLLPLTAWAQPLDQLEPAPVPPQVEAPPAEVVLPDAEAGRVSELSVPRTDEIIVEALKGVAFFPTAEAALSGPADSGIHFAGLDLLNTTVFRGVVASYLEQPVTRTLLLQVTTATQVYLSQQGYPFSIAYLPEQDITTGVVRVIVVLSRVESEVEVEGAKYFSPALYQAQVRTDSDAPLNAGSLREDVAWINRNPFRAAVLSARAGDAPGTTKLVLQVKEQRPVRVFAGANNTGTQTTKEERVFAGVNWGNAWGLGHQMSAQWTSSWDFETMRSVSGSYVVDLPWRHTLSFSGAYSATKGVVSPPFALRGESWQVGADYAIPLPVTSERFSQTLSFGADFKSSDNNFTFATIPITDNLTHVAQARVGYSGAITGQASQTGFRATLTAAPGGLTDRNEDRYFNLSRTGAKASYVYLRADASHSLRLDQFKRGLSWSIRGEFQLSPSNLIGSEQFGAGGSNTVRGYEEGEVYKDNGGLLSHELRLPPLPLRGGHGLQLYLFQDYACLWSTDEAPGETPVDLHSVGVGLDYGFGNRLSVRAAYGWQLQDSGSSQTGDNSRLHLSGNISF